MLPGTRKRLEHRLNVHGLKISIENHKGSTRTGVDPNGKEWKTYLNHHYGYIRGVKGQDKDYLDCFVNDHPEDSELIFVVNQIKPWTKDKQFDEHKVLIGFKNKKEAKQAYLSNYDSPKYFGSISEYTIPEFKNIIGHGKKVVRTMNEHSFEKANVTLNDAKKAKAQAEKFWIKNYADPLRKLNRDDLGYPGDKNFDKSIIHEHQAHSKSGKIFNVKEHEDSRNKNLDDWEKELNLRASKGIEKALKERPERIEHGDTNKNGFWIDTEGNIYQYNKLPKNKTNLISVHSHLGSTDDKDYICDQTLNGGDIYSFIWAIKNKVGMSIAVITSKKGLFDLISLKRNTDPKLFKLNMKKLSEEADENSLREGTHRESIRKFCNKYNLRFEENLKFNMPSKEAEKSQLDDFAHYIDFDKSYYINVQGYLKHDHNGKIINVQGYGKNVYVTDKQKSENALRYIQDYFGGKYSHEMLPNGKILKIRITDHSGRMKNDEGEDEALHVVIAPIDRTKYSFNDTPENTLRFDGTEGKKKILFNIIKRIKEIKNQNQHIPEKYFVSIEKSQQNDLEYFIDIEKAHVHGYLKHSKKGNVITVRQYENKKVGRKEKGVQAKNPWIKEFGKYKLTRFPDPSINKKDVTVDLEGDLDKHAVLKWRDPKTNDLITSYTQGYMKVKKDEKYNRVNKLLNDKKLDKIKSQSLKNLNSKNRSLSETSAILFIIADSGLRVGSHRLLERTGNKGVTTASPKEFKIIGSKVEINYTGKSYQHNTTTIDNKQLADYLNKLKSERKNENTLFNVKHYDVANTLRDILGTSKVKTKDLRTFVATRLAKEILMKNRIKELPEKISQRKRLIKEKLKQTYEEVSKKLNNTPGMVKNSYINPNVIHDWLDSMNIDNHDMYKAILEVPTQDMIKEHTRLTNVLKHGSSKQLHKEYDEQNSELKEYKMENKLGKKKKIKDSKVEKVMHEFKTGKLKDGHGKLVTEYDQAMAIALSEQKRKDEGKSFKKANLFVDSVYLDIENVDPVPFISIEKAHIKGYERHTKSGKIVQVKQHEDSRQQKIDKLNEDIDYYTNRISFGSHKSYNDLKKLKDKLKNAIIERTELKNSKDWDKKYIKENKNKKINLNTYNKGFKDGFRDYNPEGWGNDRIYENEKNVKKRLKKLEEEKHYGINDNYINGYVDALKKLKVIKINKSQQDEFGYFIDIEKAQVKAHQAHSKTGKIIQVKQYTNKVMKKNVPIKNKKKAINDKKSITKNKLQNRTGEPPEEIKRKKEMSGMTKNKNIVNKKDSGMEGTEKNKKNIIANNMKNTNDKKVKQDKSVNKQDQQQQVQQQPNNSNPDLAKLSKEKNQLLYMKKNFPDLVDEKKLKSRIKDINSATDKVTKIIRDVQDNLEEDKSSKTEKKVVAKTKKVDKTKPAVKESKKSEEESKSTKEKSKPAKEKSEKVDKKVTKEKKSPSKNPELNKFFSELKLNKEQKTGMNTLFVTYGIKTGVDGKVIIPKDHFNNRKDIIEKMNKILGNDFLVKDMSKKKNGILTFILKIINKIKESRL